MRSKYRSLIECPEYFKTELRNRKGEPVVDCGTCAYGVKTCKHPKRKRIEYLKKLKETWKLK